MVDRVVDYRGGTEWFNKIISISKGWESIMVDKSLYECLCDCVSVFLYLYTVQTIDGVGGVHN